MDKWTLEREMCRAIEAVARRGSSIAAGRLADAFRALAAFALDERTRAEYRESAARWYRHAEYLAACERHARAAVCS